MAKKRNVDSVARSLSRELEAARARLVRWRGGAVGGKVALTAYELSSEVERLCQKAMVCGEGDQADRLLALAQDRLNDLQKLLGVH